MRSVDLFCGAGGLSLGLKKAGVEVIGAVDHWELAVDTYRVNVGRDVWRDDIRDVVTVAPKVMDLKPTMVAGGPPCQDFSSAGPGIEGERAELMIAFAMTLAIVRPEWILMENVARARKSATWARARNILKGAGYGLTEVIVDASWYGVAQTRKRLIVVGRLGEADGFLATEIADARQSRQTTVRDVIGNEVGGDTNSRSLTCGVRSEFYTKRTGLVAETSGRQESDFYFVRPFKGGRGVRSIDEPAPALVRTSREPPASGYLASPSPLDPVPAERVPLLTQRQTALLQGFPIDWDWSCASRVRDIDQMIVNAVPTKLAEAIGRVILSRHAGISTPVAEDAFSDWLRSRGMSGQVLRNRRYALGRARRLLGGRVIADLTAEIHALEQADGFSDLSASTRSDLRGALRAYSEWRAMERPRTTPRKAAART